MTDKKESPEELGGHVRGLEKKDRIKRLSSLKKDSKGFAQRILKDNSITLLAGREKSSVLHNVVSCADYLTIRRLLLTGKTKVINARLCKKHLICSFCAHLRASKIIQRYLKIYKSIVGSQKSYHVIFTIKDGEDLKERFNHLNSSFYSLLRDRRRGTSELTKITSGIYSYEFKRGKNSGIWHPHIHSIMLTSEYIYFSKLISEWEKITVDSKNIKVIEFYGNDTDENLIKPFLEVFKYALKFSELTDSDRVMCYNILSSRHLVNSFGEFRGFIEPKNLLDEVSKEDLFYIDLILKYEDGLGYVLSHNDIIFSEQFKPVFKLQALYKKHGDKILDRVFDEYTFDVLHEKLGFDCRGFMVDMIKSNISGMKEIEEYLIKKGGKLLEGSPEPIASAPETKTDIQEWISKAIYNKTDEKKG